MAPLATLHNVVLDCPDPAALAGFYHQVLGGTVTSEDDGEWVTLTVPERYRVAFQRAPGLVPPRWPSADHSQQLHLDLWVTDVDAAEKEVLALGATLLDRRSPEEDFRVYADPAGHPFCLCY